MSRPWFRARTLAALGTAVAEIRRAAGLTQTDAADVAGSSRPTISRMERGQPVTSSLLIAMLEGTGYEVVIVPRGARVIVQDPA
jgi:transcriptional regulator with XRE-family HTH domain